MGLRRSLLLSSVVLLFLFSFFQFCTAEEGTITLLTYGGNDLLPLVYKRALKFAQSNQVRIKIYASDDSNPLGFQSYVKTFLNQPTADFIGLVALITPRQRVNCSFSQCYLDQFKNVKKRIGPITGVIMDSSWIPDFVQSLQNLTAAVLGDNRLDWEDIFPPQQSFVSYNDSIYGVPFDSNFFLLYYREDVVQRGSKGDPPSTWSDYVSLAREVYLTDMNDDRKPDYGSCISQQEGGVSADRFLLIFASVAQTIGTKQGAFFDAFTSDGIMNMEPIIDNEAFGAALDDWSDASKYDQEEKESSLSSTRRLFLEGSCALTIDTFQLAVKLQAGKDYASSRVNVIVTPGSDYALDRKKMRLVSCSSYPGTCPTAEPRQNELNNFLPHSEGEINYAPYFFGGWSGVINRAAKGSLQRLAYRLFAYMSYPEQSNDDTLQGLAFEPFRFSQISLDDACKERWRKAGFNEGMTFELIQTIRSMVVHPNRVQGLSISGVLELKMDLEKGIKNYRDNNSTLAGTGDWINKQWVRVLDSLNEAQIKAYLASLDNNGIEVTAWWYDDDDSGSILSIILPTILGSFLILLIGAAFLWRQRRNKFYGMRRTGDEDDESLIPPSKNGWKIEPGMVKINQKMATTSYGDVYRGKYQGSDVSITKVNPSLIGEETRLQLITELAVVSELRHNNVLLTHGGCMDPPNLFVVSELTSKNLYDVVHSEDVRLPARLAHSFASDLARGMDYLHSCTPPIIHSSLSSSNVLVDKKWNLKITNFSNYKLFEVAGARQKSLPWVAPEILRGGAPTEKSDVYSFGIMLWELLSRKHPYDNMHPQVVLISVQDGLRPYVPPTWKKPLVKLIENCWNSNAEQRPTFKEIRSRLSGIDPGWMKPSFPSSIASQFNLAALSQDGEGETTHLGTSPRSSTTKSFTKAVYPNFSGEITVLYTNIYGYNVLWREYPQEMERSVALHNDILRGIINNGGGFVARCDSDSFMALFSDHVAAVKCALKAQEDLLAASWPKDILTSPLAREQRESGGSLLFRGLRVRMGVNTGELNDKLHTDTTLDFSDKLLSNAGKITALAQGGEILISKRTYRRIKPKLQSLNHPYICDVRVEKGGHKVFRVLPTALEGRFSLDFDDTFSLNFPTASSIVHSPSVMSLRSDESLESPRLPSTSFSSMQNSMTEPLLRDSLSSSVVNPPSVATYNNKTNINHPSYKRSFNPSSYHPSYHPSFNAASYLPVDSCPNSFNPAASFNPDGAPSWTMERYQVPFDQLKIEKKIGEGSYGEVYKAKWRGTTVAVKRFFRQQATDQILLELRKESVIMSELRHPNIILFLGVCLTPPNLCIISEYMKNGCVGKYLRNRSNNITWSVRLTMLNQVAMAMAYLHSFNPPVIHRDLSSYNLLVDDDMTVKVADFGLSRIKACNAVMTQCGTAAWTAPEILDGLSYSETTDVYSFAIIMWEFLTRKKPFKGQAVGTISQQVISGVRPTLPEDAPGSYVALVRDCWTADPVLRPSFEIITQRLETLLREFEETPW